MKIRISDVGKLFGKKLPEPGKKGDCPFNKHAKRMDKTFRVFEAKVSRDELAKCWSCDKTWDAVGLYAELANIERVEAFKRIRDLGFEIAGARDDFRPRERERGPVLSGRRPDVIVDLDLSVLDELQGDAGAIATARRFVASRGLDPDLCAEHVVGLPRAGAGAVGFVYVDPDRERPCRIKVRKEVVDPDGTRRKLMWMVPKGNHETGARALAPLFLAQELARRRTGHLLTVVVLVEGELDALTIREAASFGEKGPDGSLAAAFRTVDVVSLPDGSASVMTADLRELSSYTSWACAFDDDAAGDEAFVKLERRMKPYGVDLVRVWFSQLGADGVERIYKDANEAWQAGMRGEALLGCIDRALEDRYGYALPWRTKRTKEGDGKEVAA